MNLKNKEFKCKVFVLGDSKVGKTCFIQRFCQNIFKDNISTIGCDMLSKEYVLSDGTKSSIDFWDTAGQERFKSITKSMIKNADGIILMYDITNEETFNSVSQWISDIKQIVSPHVRLLLVGNKSDLDDKRVIQVFDGQEKAASHNISFYETSSKENKNIDQSVKALVEDFYTIKKYQINGSITLSLNNKKSNKKSKQDKCC